LLDLADDRFDNLLVRSIAASISGPSEAFLHVLDPGPRLWFSPPSGCLCRPVAR
jgi:hypothetical protein